MISIYIVSDDDYTRLITKYKKIEKNLIIHSIKITKVDNGLL